MLPALLRVAGLAADSVRRLLGAAGILKLEHKSPKAKAATEPAAVQA